MDTIRRDMKNGLTDVNILDREDWRMAVSRATDMEEPSRWEVEISITFPLLFHNIFNFHVLFFGPFSMTFHDKIFSMLFHDCRNTEQPLYITPNPHSWPQILKSPGLPRMTVWWGRAGFNKEFKTVLGNTSYRQTYPESQKQAFLI